MDQQPPQNPQQPYYQPQQPYYQQPQGSSPQQPYYQQPQGSPLPPPPQQPYYQPPFNPGQMTQPPQQAPQKGLWPWYKRQRGIGKVGIGCGALLVLMMACGLCNTIVTAANSTAQTTQTATATTSATQTPVTPTPTQKPKPTPTPKPTQSPAQIEAAYKAKTANTSVTNIDKMGNGYKDKDLHFTAVIMNFVKDSDGNTAGANVSDTDSGSSSVIQIGFVPGTDLTKMNQGDTVEVWGRDIGVSSGKNAFGGDIQEAGVAVAFINDQTTGYQK